MEFLPCSRYFIPVGVIIRIQSRALVNNLYRKPFILVLALPLIFITVPAVADDPVIGSIKTVAGTASIIRQNKSLNAEVGIKLHEKDTLKTGRQGRIGVILRDDTRLSMGPNSEINLHQFAFSPVRGDLSIITRLLKGTLAYVSGQIGKLSSQAVRLETPVATVGIRGTHFVAKAMAD